MENNFHTIGIRIDEIRGPGKAKVAYPVRPYIIETGGEIPVRSIKIDEGMDCALVAHLEVYVTTITHGQVHS